MSLAGLGYILEATDVDDMRRRIAEVDRRYYRRMVSAAITGVVIALVVGAIALAVGHTG